MPLRSESVPSLQPVDPLPRIGWKIAQGVEVDPPEVTQATIRERWIGGGAVKQQGDLLRRDLAGRQGRREGREVRIRRDGAIGVTGPTILDGGELPLRQGRYEAVMRSRELHDRLARHPVEKVDAIPHVQGRQTVEHGKPGVEIAVERGSTCL